MARETIEAFAIPNSYKSQSQLKDGVSYSNNMGNETTLSPSRAFRKLFYLFLCLGLFLILVFVLSKII